MCGIIGILGRLDVVSLLVAGLKRLEYRGYDSAGVTVLDQAGALQQRRAAGKLSALEDRVTAQPVSGQAGIGHTRWATHGPPTEVNAHPHVAGRVALVHNGIIENHMALKAELAAAGRQFDSQTDSEVAAHLLDSLLAEGQTPAAALASLMARLQGAFSLLALIQGEPDLLLAARLGSPLAIGFGEGEMYVGSDGLALAPMTRRIAYLEDGDQAVVRRDGAVITDRTGRPVDRPPVLTELSGAVIGKGNHRHFMEKEIYEQPEVVMRTLVSMTGAARGEGDDRAVLQDLDFGGKVPERLLTTACGTAFYAGLVGRYWIEELARLPVEADVASEWRYRDVPLAPGGLAVFVSQSGETMDSLMALRHARAAEQRILSIVNVPESTIARESDHVLRTLAGPEIGVASTKAFTTQLVVLACLAIRLGLMRGTLTAEKGRRLVDALYALPSHMEEVLRTHGEMGPLGHRLAEARDLLYLGRGTGFPLAMEGALKLKEISYIHAEGYAAGEMKHGPIALIDEAVPVVVLAPPGPLFEKVASAVEEVAARGGRVVLISDAEGTDRLRDKCETVLPMPKADPFVAPILYALPVQLLAYHTAVAKGTDVDQPRNLAKSVTVE